MNGEAAMIGWGVEPAAAFIVSNVVGRNGSPAERALLRVKGV
jgi:hypothetical protein